MKQTLATFLLIIWASLCAYAQTEVRGYVREVGTEKPLAHATILVANTSEVTTSNDSGYFELEIQDDEHGLLQFMLPKYQTEEALFRKGISQEVTVWLEPLVSELEGVTVRGRKKKYRNKDNPAVALVREVIAHKDQNRTTTRTQFTQRAMYEKLSVGVTNLPKFITRNPLFRPFRFIFENQDTSSLPGQKLFLIYIDEQWSDFYTRKTPAATKKIVNDRKRISLDPKFINEDGTVAMLQHLYQDIDVYDNHFLLVTTSFKSPIADGGPTFYKYFIEDTITRNNNRYVRLFFTPRNKNDLLLEGEMVIAIDEQYAVSSMSMYTTKATNINFIKELRVDVYFEKDDSGKFYVDEIENEVQFALFNSKQRMKGTRTVFYEQYQEPEALPDTLFRSPDVFVPDDLQRKEDLAYEAIRPVPFTPVEQRTYDNLDSMKKMRYYRNLIDWGSALFSGYKNLGLLEIGDLYRIYSRNPIEGSRFRMGLRTNPMMAQRYFATGYLAYGTRDQRLKYYTALTYSLKNKAIYEYPMHFFKVSTQYDVKVPGRVMETTVQDILTENIQRGVNNKFIYTRNIFAEYNREFEHNLWLKIDGMYLEQEAGGTLYFVKESGMETDTVGQILSNNFGAQIRWAPGEKFYNNRTQRSRQFSRAPEFTLRTDFGIAGIFGSTYGYQKLSLDAFKRWYLGSLGLLDSRLRVSCLWGDLPYPLLHLPRANQSYTFSTGSYNLMNNGEFVADRFAELHLNYRMLGFILNKIPLLKRLQLREAAGVKILYGGLSPNNNPAFNPNAMRFPTDDLGNSYIYTFDGNVPYIEWNVGIENIFKIFRLDYVRRLNYLDHPNVSKHRIQFSLVYDF